MLSSSKAFHAMQRWRCAISSSNMSLTGTCIPQHHHYQQRATRQQSTNTSDDDETTDKAVLIIGSSGALGSVIAQHLKQSCGCFTIGADFGIPKKESEDDSYLDAVLELSADHSSIPELAYGLETGIQETLDAPEGSRVEFDAIIVASGGFAMDPPPPDLPRSSNRSKDKGGTHMNQDYWKAANVYEHMMKMNYNPVVAAGTLIPNYMTCKSGLFIVMGASAALTPTPGLLAYGSSKAAAHAYVQSLGLTTGKALKNKYLHRNTSPDAMFQRQLTPYLTELTVCGILPSTIDTEANRMAMPEEDFGLWTPPLDIAQQIGTWLETPALRPHSGSLVKAETTGDCGESNGIRTQYKLVR